MMKKIFGSQLSAGDRLSSESGRQGGTPRNRPAADKHAEDRKQNFKQMKTLYKCAWGLTAVLAFSCSSYEPLKFEAEKPSGVVVQEEIDSYPALKSFIDRSAHPQFKLGMALSLNPYANQEVIYRLANRNFDEIVLGYEMKHGAVVKSDGTSYLDDVKRLIETAKTAGTHVYGHTLCWHANQNAEYLNRLIEPIIIPGTSQPSWDRVTAANFETDESGNYEANSNAILSFTAAGQGANGEGRAYGPTTGIPSFSSNFLRPLKLENSMNSAWMLSLTPPRLSPPRPM